MTILFVHGGVSGISKPAHSLAYALALPEGTSCLDAVERAVRALEDDPRLNAGLGSVLNLDGRLELDAGIVDGITGGVGAVANVTARHPISLARKVMEETPHVLLTGAGAERFGAGEERLLRSTDEEHAKWQDARDAGRLGSDTFGAPEFVDTVGAVAVDASGGTAAGSSTGGVFGKMPGRVGDAPVFGAGIYASPQVAVVGTGVGELFLETLACMRVGALVEDGSSPQAAVEEVVRKLGRRSDVPAGLLALDTEGRTGAAFRGGSWDVEGPEGPFEAVKIA